MIKLNFRKYATQIASKTVYFPSVSHLIAKHRIETAILDRIPRTGPKNRLLKGDVLAYLQNPKILGTGASPQTVNPPVVEEFKPQAYYYKTIEIDSLIKFAQKTGVNLNDAFIKIVAVAVQKVPEINVQYVSNTKKSVPLSNDIFVRRLANRGSSVAELKNAHLVKMNKISEHFKKPNPKATANGSFTIYDQSGSKAKVLYPILLSQSVILKMGSPLKIGQTPSKNKLDFLGKNIKPSSGSISTNLEFLMKPTMKKAIEASKTQDRIAQNVLPIDLVVDSRAITSASVEKFFKTLQSFINKPETVQ